MQRLMSPVLLSLLLVSTAVLSGTRSFGTTGKQEEQKESASPQQQQDQQSQQTQEPQGQSSAAVQSVTGCLVRSNTGYSLKTDTDTYPIETGRDLSQYVNKRIKVTGILEHHNAAAPSTENSNAIAMTDIRLRMVASVVGDCK